MLLENIYSLDVSKKEPVILVIGDLMVDQYIFGTTTRISPEAPVPVVNVTTKSRSLGGAGNVAQNLVSLGAKVILSGLIGNDEKGQQLKELLVNKGLSVNYIITDDNRPTTSKIRVMANNCQLVRIDNEITTVISKKLGDQLIDMLSSQIDIADLIIFSDYNKGLFSHDFSRRIIRLANQKKKKVIVDPKGLDYSKYKGAFLIKPNRKEFLEASNVDNLENIQSSAQLIFSQTEAEFLVITLSEDGMILLTETSGKFLPVKPTEVYDVTGAGDTVLSTIAYFFAAGLSIEDSCEAANHAAAIVVGKIGCASTTTIEIVQHILDSTSNM